MLKSSLGGPSETLRTPVSFARIGRTAFTGTPMRAAGRARCGAVAPMKPAAVILALDASSTRSVVACTRPEPHAHGTVLLPARRIAERCMQAQQALDRLLDRHPAIDVIAIESPVARFAKALIPQARVSGALLAVAAAAGTACR